MDLRVSIEKAEPHKAGVLSEPQFEAIKPMSTVERGSNISRFGEKAKTEND